VLHGDARDIEEFLDLIDDVAPRDKIVVGAVGPVIGTHAGPGVLGVTYQTAD
jgi:fatty acid-binding protein DegV